MSNTIQKQLLILGFCLTSLSSCFGYTPPKRAPFPERILVFKQLPEGLKCTLLKENVSSTSGFGCGNYLQGRAGSYKQVLKLVKQQAFRAKANTVLIKEILYPPEQAGCQREEIQMFADLYQCTPRFVPDAP